MTSKAGKESTTPAQAKKGDKSQQSLNYIEKILILFDRYTSKKCIDRWKPLYVTWMLVM